MWPDKPRQGEKRLWWKERPRGPWSPRSSCKAPGPAHDVARLSSSTRLLASWQGGCVTGEEFVVEKAQQLIPWNINDGQESHVLVALRSGS